MHKRVKTEVPVRKESKDRPVKRDRRLSAGRSLTLLTSGDVATQNRLSRVSTDFRLQRELQRALLQLQQREDDLRTAVEIGDNLVAENEEAKEEVIKLHQENNALKEEVESLQSLLSDSKTQIMVLKERLTFTESSYDRERARFENDIKDRENRVEKLQEEIENQKSDFRMVQEVAEWSRSRKQEAARSPTLASFKPSTDVERKLMGHIHNLEDELQENKMKHLNELERSMNELQQAHKRQKMLNKEKEKLEKRIEELSEWNQTEIDNTKAENKAISAEIVALAKRNTVLEREIEELTILLEDRDHELYVLESQLEYAKGENDDLGNDVDDDDTEQLTSLAEQLRSIQQNRRTLSRSTDFLRDRESSFEGSSVADDKKDTVAVPDVLKEYLHLTASAVKIKFPEVTSVTSEQLIQQVQHLSFYQYHDYMVRIMKTTEAQQREKKIADHIKPQKSPSGFLGRFFGGVFGGTTQKEIQPKVTNSPTSRAAFVPNQARRYVVPDKI